MNLSEIIQSSEYIYSTHIAWALKKYLCNVEYYTEEPLDDLCYVICSLLAQNKGIYDKKSLGLLLGFSVVNFENEGKHYVYYDNAEVSVFNDLLNKVEKERLIRINDKDVLLTKLGEISLREGKHYRFYSGHQNIYEHIKLKSETPIAMLMFPFYKDMGIYTSLIKNKQIWPDDENIESIIFTRPNQLIKRLENHSKDITHIYNAEQEELFDIESIKVLVNLYQSSEGYIPIVMNCEQIAEKATFHILSPINSYWKENIILECLFQKLWNDEDAILDYKTLKPYFELVDYEELTKDSRTNWDDEQLLMTIFKNASQTCWRNISRFCCLNSTYNHIEEIYNQLYWPIFTKRADDDFIIHTFTKYPWDLEVLSEDNNRNINTIEKLILIKKNTIEDWNWEVLEFRLSKDFVLSNIDIVKVNLAQYTVDTKDVQLSIISNIDKKWDWYKIESEFSLQFILDNICALSEHFSFKMLFDRVFTDELWAEKFALNINFHNSIKKAIAEDGVLSSCILNSKNYVWTTSVIDSLLSIGLIRWKSEPYIKGFECNPALKWTKSFFDRYSKYIITDVGHSVVSKAIEDITIILKNPTFEWNWDDISANISLLSDVRLFTEYGNKLNWRIVFENNTDNRIFECIDNIDTMIGDDEQAWTKFSNLATIDYVINKYKENAFPWNWRVLTKRMFKNLRLENLGNPLFVDKWDWDFLSENVPENFLKSNLNKFKMFWNWDIVLDRLIIDKRKFNIHFLNEIAIIFLYIPDKDKRKEAWSSLTKKYSFEELKIVIGHTINHHSFMWDIKYFCNHEDFNIFKDLDECRNFVDWDVLSKSKAVDKSFKFNPKLKIKIKAWNEDIIKILKDNRNKWNFKLLSSFESLRDQKWFISNFRDKIDWKIISNTSNLFATKDNQEINEIIYRYKYYIDFKELSKRTDININQYIKIYPQGNFDYNQLIEHNTIGITMEIINQNRYYPWNWQIVTSARTFIPTAQFLLNKINDDINWEYITSQENKDAWSNLILLKKMAYNKEIVKRVDWIFISKLEYFPIDIELYQPIREKLNWKKLSHRKQITKLLGFYDDYLDWRYVSENIELNEDILEKYKDCLDWNIICKRITFSNGFLEKYANYIDWNLASVSEDINFTSSLVNKYKNKWNWPELIKNRAFHNKIDIYDMSIINQLNIIEFVRQFPKRPKAYHFTHMSNALKIIQTMKLQSRNKAKGNFSNSAGLNVNRTDKAHDFARFYFAPKSPTQFYNECLGKDYEDKRYYERAKNNGLPKCPLPVFFIFDIEEILMQMPEKCFYSTGNMQKDSTKYFKVTENPNLIKAREIYYEDYRDSFDERQQEFLVKDELDFSNLKNVEIYCYDDYQTDLLRNELKGTKWEDIVKTTNGCNLYERCNKRIYFDESIDAIHISTNYEDPFEFRVDYYDNNVPTIINNENVIGLRENSIFIKASVKVIKDKHFYVYFEDRDPKENRKRSWLIYKN